MSSRLNPNIDTPGVRMRSATFVMIEPSGNQLGQRSWLEAVRTPHDWTLIDMVWIPPSGDDAPILRRSARDDTHSFTNAVAALAAFEQSRRASSFIPDPDDTGQNYKALKFRDLAVQHGIAFLASGEPVLAPDGLLRRDGTYLESIAREILNPDPARPDLVAEFSAFNPVAENIYLLTSDHQSALQKIYNDMWHLTPVSFLLAGADAYRDVPRVFGFRYKARYFQAPNFFSQHGITKDFSSHMMSFDDPLRRAIGHKINLVEFLQEMLCLAALANTPAAIKDGREKILYHARKRVFHSASVVAMSKYIRWMTTDHYLKNFDMLGAIDKIQEIRGLFFDLMSRSEVNLADPRLGKFTDSDCARLALDLYYAHHRSGSSSAVTVPANSPAGFTLTDDNRKFFKEIERLEPLKNYYLFNRIPVDIWCALERKSKLPFFGRLAYFEEPDFFEGRKLFIKTVPQSHSALKNLPESLYQLYVENINLANVLVCMQLLFDIRRIDKADLRPSDHHKIFNDMVRKSTPYFDGAGLGVYQDLMTSPYYIENFSTEEASAKMNGIRVRFNDLATRKVAPDTIPLLTPQDRLALVYSLSNAYPLPHPGA